MSGSIATVGSERIRIQPSFADLLRVQRLGGRFNTAAHAWEWPATHDNALRLHAALRALRTTPEFDALLVMELPVPNSGDPPSGGVLTLPVTVESQVPSPEVPLPTGLLTRPWRHQLAAFEFCMKHFNAGMRGLLLAMSMGCIGGDADIIINRRGCARRITLREFHRKFHGGESNGRCWCEYPTRTRSLVGGELRLNEVLDVIAQGTKSVVRIALASGKFLRVTPDHEIACPGERWVRADTLTPGSAVLTNGVPACNQIRHDNRPENLEVMPVVDHLRHHGKHGGYLHLQSESVQFVPQCDTVVSVTPDGETDVYDVRMAGPGHSFVANGIIVHNCGKSLVFCMLLLALGARRTLIACPLRVVPVWVTQFERHVGIPVTLVALDDEVGSVAKKQDLAFEKLRLAETLNQPYVCLINYDSAWRSPFAEWARKINWDLIGHDEAHKLKANNGQASKYFARLSLRAKYRVALTGTPMPHNHTDIFGILRAVDMSIFGQFWGPFKREYCQMGGFKNKQIVGPRNLAQLEAKVARVMFRVGPEVLDLPPETRVTYTCELSPEGRRVYRTLDQFFVAGVKEGTITVANAMVKVLRLAQLTGGWLPTDDGEPCHVDDSKQKLLEDTLEDIGGQEPVVVFCWFHQDLDAVHDACRRLKYTSMELSGRKDELKTWQNGKAQVLAVQIKSGGVGVDFTRARYSIFYSLGFSLADYEQAKKRVHRPGQTRPVEHIHLVAKGTVDERIMRALEKRAEVIEAILAEIISS